jgi:hypothetical protein
VTAATDRLPTEFPKDVAEHEMAVLLDDGLYRHVRFSKPGTWSMGFDLTTWPGYLCFSGDMGCYVFSRLPDMFKFFRQAGVGPIDFRYWAEKVQAADRSVGIEEFSPALFRDAVERCVSLYGGAGGGEDEPAVPQDLRDAVGDRVLSRADDGEHEALRAAMEFEHEGFTFRDFWEYGVRDYTYRFLWCCHAIAWAVRQWDAAGAGPEAPEETSRP